MRSTFLDKDGLEIVANNVKTRLKIVTTMPSTPENGMVRLYAGTDTADYKIGHVYQYNGTSWEDLNISEADLVYNPNAETPQSGKAINMAVNKFIGDNTELIWEPKTWNNLPSDFGGCRIWTDGTNIYSSFQTSQVVLNKTTDTWESKTWNISNINGQYVWYDNDNIYYSGNNNQSKFNKTTGSWVSQNWGGRLGNLWTATYLWFYNGNVYFSSNGGEQYILNRATDTWEEKTWYGIDRFDGFNVWTDGSNVYISDGSTQYVLNESTDTWEPKTWYGLTNFYANETIWSDGASTYYLNGSRKYVLDVPTSTWKPITFSGLTGDIYTYYLWTDGEYIYSSNGNNASKQYIAHRTLNTNIR